MGWNASSSQPEVSPGGFGAVPSTCAAPTSGFKGGEEGGKEECALTGTYWSGPQ